MYFKYLIIPLLMLCEHLMAQTDCVPYYRELSVAKYENFKGETEKAIKRFEQANSNYPTCTDLGSKLTFVKMYLKVDDKKTAYKLLIEELKKGYKLESLGYIGIFKNNLGIYYDSLDLKEDSLHQLFYANIDHELLFFVHGMFSIDQRIFYVTNIQDSLRTDIRHQIFRDNITTLVSYVNEHGIIGYKELGHHLAWITCILMHHRLDDNIDYKNIEILIKKYNAAIKQGNIAPKNILNLYDNMSEIIDNGKLQLLGKFYNPKTKKFYPIKDISSVDSLRLSLGLNTLREYAEMRGIDLPEGYGE